jgi:lipopolysaccharide transport protein LptA
VLPRLLTGLALAPLAGAAEGDRCTQPVEVNGDQVEANYKTNNVELRNVVISQCDVRVAAKRAHANGLDVDNARWTFEGDVRIDVEKRGSLRADQADIEFRNSQIAKATITGKPAEFEQKRADSDAMAHGRAGEIVYDVGAGTVKLSNDAWLSDGRTEIKGPQIVYNIRQQQVQGSSQPGANQRVRITITPNNAPRSGGQKPAGDRPGSDSNANPSSSASPSPSPNSNPTPNPNPSQTPKAP